MQESNLIIVTSITQMDTPQAPAISENGVITAGGFGGFQSAAPGSFIEIYGSNLRRRSFERMGDQRFRR